MVTALSDVVLRWLILVMTCAIAADAEFSGYSDRHRLQVLIKNVDLIVGDWTADRNRCRRPRTDIIVSHGERTTAYCRFSGTIMIDHRAIAGVQNTICQVPA